MTTCTGPAINLVEGIHILEPGSYPFSYRMRGRFYPQADCSAQEVTGNFCLIHHEGF